MKKGKDDEKLNAPMFPRLHVNDADKGGPKAPPRNKMALYERLSIPPQRFNPGVMALNRINTTNMGSQATVSQVSGLEGNYSFPLHLPPATSSRLSSATNMATISTQLDQTKKVENDDFKVPVYVQRQTDQLKDNTFSRERLTSAHTIYSGCSAEIQSEYDRDSQQSASLCLNKGRDAGILNDNNQKDLRNAYELQLEVSEIGSDQSSKSTKSSSTRDNYEGCRREGNLCGSQEHQHPVSDFSVQNDDAWIHMKSNTGLQSDDAGDNNYLFESTRYTRNEGTTWHVGSVEDPSNPTKDNSFQKDDNRIRKSFQLTNLDKCDVSTISMVDVVSAMSISPDDVVEVLGQKHFWKARRAISKVARRPIRVLSARGPLTAGHSCTEGLGPRTEQRMQDGSWNYAIIWLNRQWQLLSQQRVFAVQVFELHRLIKVQQLIAGSPEVLLEDTVFLEKSSTKKIRLEYVTKPRAQNPKSKDNSENLSHKIECSAENAVGKPSLSSTNNSSHLSNYPHFSGNALQENMATDTKMSPWCFPQPGHQWLVPVMSPSEGLIYKPYPGPGFSGSFPGGYGPYGPASWARGFMNSVYGWPAPYHGAAVVPGTQLVSQPYFPSSGMPIINSGMSGAAVEQMSHVGGPCSFGQRNQSSAGVSSSTTKQMPSDALNYKDGTAPRVVKLRASKESEAQEVQGSTASSPGEIVQSVAAVAPGQNEEGGGAFSSFPVSLSAQQQTRVVKVVPHNGRSATESAARIFQSIQEERKHFDFA